MCIRDRQRSFDLLYGKAARQAFTIEKEGEKTRDRYGRNPLGQNLLLARRLIESGVRLVNVAAWTGLAKGEKFVSVETWDMHGNADVGIFENGWNGLPFALPRTDQAVATLLEDLEDRGLLDTTLVVLVGEFGRTPTVELPTPGSNAGKINGRDHNHHGFTMWMAGGGAKGGSVYGATDEFGFRAEVNRMHVHDLHATMLAMLGFDHEKFTFRQAARDFRLTDVHGKVIHDLIA